MLITLQLGDSRTAAMVGIAVQSFQQFLLLKGERLPVSCRNTDNDAQPCMVTANAVSLRTQ